VNRQYIIWCLVFVFLLGISIQGNAQEETDFVESLGMDAGTMNWTTKVLRVKGNGVGPDRVKDLGRRKILAKRAAQMDAFRNLVGAVNGVFVTSNSSVQDLMLESDSIRTKTNGMIKGMRVVDVTYSNDGGCEVTVEVNIDEKGGFLLTALNDLNVNVKDDYPTLDVVGMMADLEKTKADLSKTKGKLAASQRRLRTKQNQLGQTEKELEETKAEYADLREDFKNKQDQLIAANEKLIRTEEKLKYANLRKEDLKDALDATENQLESTKLLVDNLREKFNDKKIKLAVSEAKFAMAWTFLQGKKAELDKLSGDLNTYRTKYKNASLDIETLKGYIYRLKDVQKQTSVQVGIIQPFLTPDPGLPGSSMNVTVQQAGGYTGILVDARGLNPKPILAPSLLTENREKVYGIGVTYISVTTGSLVDYIPGSLDNAKKHRRVGNNPLVIKPLKVVNDSDLMIGGDDVERVAGLLPLLKEQKVAILL